MLRVTRALAALVLVNLAAAWALVALLLPAPWGLLVAVLVAWQAAGIRVGFGRATGMSVLGGLVGAFVVAFREHADPFRGLLAGAMLAAGVGLVVPLRGAAGEPPTAH